MGKDQYTFDKPVTRYGRIAPPEQQQPEPIERDLMPVADRGEESYRGTGRLTGRRALINRRGLRHRAATAIAFAREGADVEISYLPEEEPDAERIVALIRHAGRKATALPGDIKDPDLCRSLVERTVEEFGGLDILVNNGGKQVTQDSILDISDEQFDHTMKTYVYAMFWITRAAAPHMPPGSTIINTASIQACKPSPTLIDYAATKATIKNFTKGLAQQLTPKGIRVNAVAPGPI